MKKFNVEFTKESIHSNSGLILFFKFLSHNILNHFLAPTLTCGKDSFLYSDFDIIRSYLSLLCSGHANFEHIDLFKNSEFQKQVLNLLSLPSKERLRQRLDIMALHNSSLINNLFNLNQFLLYKHAKPQTVPGHHFIPLDFDVTIFDNSNSHKQGVKSTYQHNVDGYAPMMTYFGHQGFLINQQFRSGNFHSNCKGTLEYINQTIQLAKKLTNKTILARLDSGNDATINAVHLARTQNLNFIMKRNIRSVNSRPIIIEEAKRKFTYYAEIQPNIFVYHYEKLALVQYYDFDDTLVADTVRQVYSVVESRVDKHGQLRLTPKYELHSWWTDLDKHKYPPQTIIDLYKDHATSEQFHSEFKSELDIQKMPSGKFLTNELILSLAQVTYNIIRFIGEYALDSNSFPLKRNVSRLKIRTVINKIMRLPAKFIIKNKIPTLKIPQANPFSTVFNWIYINTNFT